MTEPAIEFNSLAAELPSSPGPRGFAATGKRRYWSDIILSWLARGSAVAVLLMMASLLFVLTKAAIPSIRQSGFRFLTSSVWRPNIKTEAVKGPDGKYIRVKTDKDGNPIEPDENGRYPLLKKEIPPEFGALPVIFGTAVSSVLALFFAVPLSLGAALFLVRIAPRPLPAFAFAIPIALAVAAFTFFTSDRSIFIRLPMSLAVGVAVGAALMAIRPLAITSIVSFLIEFLAAIPSIAFGIWGLFKLRPFLLDHIEPTLNRFFGHVPGLKWLALAPDEGLTGKDMLCGGMILGIMILPIITAISRDVLAAVPRIQIEGTQALGATWWQSSFEMLRYSRSGLFGAIILGLARAAGETMAVTMVIGNSSIIRSSPLAPSQTMASLLANQFSNPENEQHTSAMLEVALILLVMSLLFNVIARWLVVGKQARTSAAH